MKKSTVLKIVGGVTVVAATTAVVIKFLPKIKETVSGLKEVFNWDSTIEDDFDSEDDFEDDEDYFEEEDFKIEQEDDENTFIQKEVEETKVEEAPTMVEELTKVEEEPVVEEMKIKPRTMDLEDDEQVDLED